MRMLSSILLSAGGAYLVLALVMYFSQHRLLFLPQAELIATPGQLGLDYEDLVLDTADGEKLHAWYVPAGDALGTVLFFHGNAGNISHRLESIARFQRLGQNVLILDYRGYGRSSGKPSERGTYLDADAAWRYLTVRRGVPAHEIAIFGRSLGAAVAIELATREPARALLVESGFTSVPDMAAHLYPWLPVRLLARIHYPSLERIARSRSPVLVLHSRDDELIPYQHGLALFEAAPEPKALYTMRGGHNDGFVTSGESYLHSLAQFIANASRNGPSQGL